MCSFSFSTNSNDLNVLRSNNIFLSKRGPDHTSIVDQDGICAIHNLLHITGIRTVQPVRSKDLLVFFNGEIYNYPKKYKNDSLALPHFFKSIDKFHSVVDGEYAIVFYDKKNELVYFLRDIFGTKPLYYSTANNKLLLSSLKSGLHNLTENIQTVLPNAIYIYNIRNKKLTIKHNIHKFDINQKKSDLSDFNTALKNAVRKRVPKQKFCVGLSSGIDSGTIALLTCKRKNSNFISILNNENKEIIFQRSSIIGGKLTTYTFDTRAKTAAFKTLLQQSEPETYLGYNYFTDSSSFCLSYIGQFCNKNNIKVFLSGTGADEIYSDYGFNGYKFTDNSCFGGLYPADLATIFPWKNFYGGTMDQYLEKDEKILGSFGIETRYPFLDKQLVQEFLWLTPAVKNRYYKYCFVDKLTKARFPFWTEKKGFSCEKK
ncbi:MAG: hypothetical protein EBU90_02455 [Proteobacteria bacterium]|nr:hypothetical protein [Pseudomonadota bacterium]NBP13097.1 hypothetical protein [bacterium]